MSSFRLIILLIFNILLLNKDISLKEEKEIYQGLNLQKLIRKVFLFIFYLICHFLRLYNCLKLLLKLREYF